MLGWYDKQILEAIARIATAMAAIAETIVDMECSLADIRFSLSIPGSQPPGDRHEGGDVHVRKGLLPASRQQFTRVLHVALPGQVPGGE